jgi:glutamate-1-semialdehyde 2,1-aminomutase
VTENSGISLYRHAKTLIPGGTQLLSKRPEMFLPDQWPAYYSRAKGVEVWDLDDNHYYDFATVGVGACALGYADPDVDAAVIEAVNAGSMCMLNAPEEVELAERLIALHPWAEMARFQRCGGEACAVAVRIARAATRRGKVAICGYHGWSDWYLAANLGDAAALDGQLLPGLDPAGVPRELAGTALTFNYNELDELEAIVSAHGDDIAAIIMEPMRASAPEPGFLEGVRAIADRIGAVLIFDEVTSGFRINLGGIHMTMGVEPDMAVFAKALGNGFPISAVIGRRSVMDHAQESFISSTMWTERLGPVAALATLAKMERDNVQAELVRFGDLINAGWARLSQRHGVDIHVSGISPLTHITFVTPLAAEAQTLYTQEMLKRGYLLNASTYTAFAYTDEIINAFIDDSDEVFGLIRSALDAGDFGSYLNGPVKHAGFKRLT